MQSRFFFSISLELRELSIANSIIFKNIHSLQIVYLILLPIVRLFTILSLMGVEFEKIKKKKPDRPMSVRDNKNNFKAASIKRVKGKSQICAMQYGIFVF